MDHRNDTPQQQAGRAIGLLIPRLAGLAALGLAGVMIGAVAHPRE
jgi:hypothetical protein